MIPEKIVKLVPKLKKTCKNIETSYYKIATDFLCNECPNNNRQTPLLVWKLHIYLQLVLHRAIDIVDSVMFSWENNMISSSSILLRALYENVTVIYDKRIRLNEAIKEKNIAKINTVLNELLLRTNIDPESEYQSERIDVICDRLEKDIPKYRKGYDMLCEYAHPNFDGMLGMYGKPIFPQKSFWEYFIKGKGKHEIATSVLISNKNGLKKDIIAPFLFMLNGNLNLLVREYEDYLRMTDDIARISDEITSAK